MKVLVRRISKYVRLYRDDESGMAWIEDGHTGFSSNVHPSTDSSFGVDGMKSCGYWGMKDRIVESNGIIYNIDRLVYDRNNLLEKIVKKECMCQGCVERRYKYGKEQAVLS